MDNAPADIYQHSLDATITGPLTEDSELARVHFTIGLVDEWQVYSRGKLHLWCAIGVRLPTHDLQAVDTILVNGLQARSDMRFGESVWCAYVARTNDRAVPLTHHDIVSILQAV